MLHEKNDFSERFKILTGYRSEKWYCWTIKTVIKRSN